MHYYGFSVDKQFKEDKMINKVEQIRGEYIFYCCLSTEASNHCTHV